jgi:glycosidase
MKKDSFYITLILLSLLAFSTNASAIRFIPEPRLKPPSWWIGFKNPNVQLMAYSENISQLRPEIDYPGVTIQQTIAVENKNYLFIDVHIDENAQPGNIDILFKDGNKVKTSMQFKLKAREKNSAKREGFSTNDAIYLLMPDRFANGDPSNDDIEGTREMSNRQEPYGRHGGDIQGIINNLDYIAEMGFTAIWLNPILENNQPQSSYHGYAITDYYKTDPRFGTNEDYKTLVQTANKKGIKIIKDLIFNHCGSKHWWMNDLPTSRWINYNNFVRSNYRISTVSDPYVSKADLRLTTEGWFDKSMPDLNLENDLLLNYLIQNSIWWIEYAGINGIRQDTYPYGDKHAMSEWNKRINLEYPEFNIVGEVWIEEAATLSYWQKDSPNPDDYNSNLKTLMDFPIMHAVQTAFCKKENETNDGLMQLYNSLANDHVYPEPQNMVVFSENHDAGRIYTILNNDLQKMKMTTAFLATVRGIPQWYYGSEILMEGIGYKSHADIRDDFPGGWPNDTTNAFKREGRTEKQNEMIDYLSAVFNYRKQSKVIHHGKTLHFIPENNVYVYFRYLDDDAIMVILNNAENESRNISANRYSEILSKYSSARDILSNKKLTSLESFEIEPKSAMIIELK